MRLGESLESPRCPGNEAVGVLGMRVWEAWE